MSKLILKKKSAKVIWAKSAAYLVGEWLGGKKKMFLPGGISWSQCGCSHLFLYLRAYRLPTEMCFF